MKIIDLQTVKPGQEISFKGLDGYETYAEGTCIFIRPKWIKCSDKFPKEEKGSIYSEDVLALNKEDGFMYIATYVETANSWHDYYQAPHGKLDGITHWMPLPKPPEVIK